IPAGVGAEAAAVLRRVEGTGSRSCRTGAIGSAADYEVGAGEDAVAEAVIEAEYLVVSEAGIEGGLGHDIGRRVEGIGRSRSAGDVVSGGGCARGSVVVGGARS